MAFCMHFSQHARQLPNEFKRWYCVELWSVIALTRKTMVWITSHELLYGHIIQFAWQNFLFFLWVVLQLACQSPVFDAVFDHWQWLSDCSRTVFCTYSEQCFHSLVTILPDMEQKHLATISFRKKQQMGKHYPTVSKQSHGDCYYHGYCLSLLTEYCEWKSQLPIVVVHH